MAHESNLSHEFFYPSATTTTVNHDMFNLQPSNYDHQIPMNNSWRGFFSEEETLIKGSPNNNNNNNNKAFVMSLHNTNQRSMASQNYMQQLQPFQLRNCKFIKPCEELLSEFCNPQGKLVRRRTTSGGNKQEENVNLTWINQYLSSMDPLELHRRKTKLFSLLEEVNRRYRQYRDQLTAITSSFESIAGEGASQIYTKLASEAMSRHFRHVKDAIMAQLHATQKALGEEDNIIPTVSGASKGETPRLKLLDQRLRKQSLFQQGGILDNNPWRPQRGLPDKAVSILRAWLFEHFLNPYPNDVDKHILARQTGLSRSQVSNWFINARVRLWKPMVEEMYNEEIKNQDDRDPKPTQTHHAAYNAAADEHKPMQQQCLSIANGIGDHNNNIAAAAARNKVSLTLGLQQNNAFVMAQSHHRERIFMSRDEGFDGGQDGHLTFLGDGDVDGLPYRNLIDAEDQLLHDLV